MATENKREKKKHSIAKEPYKKNNAKKIKKIKNQGSYLLTKDRQLEKGSLRREKGALQHPKQNRTEQH